MKYILAMMITMATLSAHGWTGSPAFGGTGFYGDGKVIKEEYAPVWVPSQIRDEYRSFSITDDVVDSSGFMHRETTKFTCTNNFAGQEVCRESMW